MISLLWLRWNGGGGGGYGRLSELVKVTLCSCFTTLLNIACPFTHNSGQYEDFRKFRIFVF